MLMRAEKDDLKEAAEESYNVIMDLNLDGRVRWVSPSWDTVIGSVLSCCFSLGPSWFTDISFFSCSFAPPQDSETHNSRTANRGPLGGRQRCLPESGRDDEEGRFAKLQAPLCRRHGLHVQTLQGFV